MSRKGYFRNTFAAGLLRLGYPSRQQQTTALQQTGVIKGWAANSRAEQQLDGFAGIYLKFKLPCVPPLDSSCSAALQSPPRG
jgi:hypothetical protein